MISIGSSGWIRTSDHSINSRCLQGFTNPRKTYKFPPKTLEVLDLQDFPAFPHVIPNYLEIAPDCVHS
jgi:hypothetical protein